MVSPPSSTRVFPSLGNDMDKSPIGLSVEEVKSVGNRYPCTSEVK